MAGTLSTRRQLLAVFCGGFVGTLTRYLLSLAIQGWLGKAWPYDILAINLSGALVLAAVTVLADAFFLIGPTRRLLVTTGFLGAYTTFSSLALGDVLLFSKGAVLPALSYLLASVCGGLAAVLAGSWFGQFVVRRFRREVRRTRPLVEQTELSTRLDGQDNLTLREQPDESESRIH